MSPYLPILVLMRTIAAVFGIRHYRYRRLLAHTLYRVLQEEIPISWMKLKSRTVVGAVCYARAGVLY